MKNKQDCKEECDRSVSQLLPLALWEDSPSFHFMVRKVTDPRQVSFLQITQDFLGDRCWMLSVGIQYWGSERLRKFNEKQWFWGLELLKSFFIAISLQPFSKHLEMFCLWPNASFWEILLSLFSSLKPMLSSRSYSSPAFLKDPMKVLLDSSGTLCVLPFRVGFSCFPQLDPSPARSNVLDIFRLSYNKWL